MWQILLLSIIFVVAEDLRVVHGQDVTGQLNYSPAIKAPLPYSQPTLNFSTGNLGIKYLEVPLSYNKINSQFEWPQTSSDNCPQLEILENILTLLKRLLNQGDNTYALQPDKKIQILHSLNEYLENSGHHVSDIDNRLKLKELIARTDKAALFGNEASTQPLNDINKRNQVEANLIFKYDVPAINNLGCKEALATLIQTVKNAHLQVLKYCNLSGKCKLNSESDPLNIAPSDKSRTLHSILGLDTMPTQTKETPSNPNLLNIYDTGSTINNLVETNNQVMSQKISNDYFNSNTQAQSELNSNGYLTTNGFSDIVQTQNNERKNVEAYNKEIQSNTQNSDISNLLNSFPSFHQPMPRKVQISSANQYPWHIPNVQSPVNNLKLITQSQGSPRVSNDYLKYYEQPIVLNTNNFLSNSASLNTGIYQTKSKETENVATMNNKHLNIIDSSDIKRIINTPTIANIGYNPIPMLKTQNIERYVPTNYYPNQQLHKIVNDKSTSVAMFNQNNQNIKEQIQYEGTLIPSHEAKNSNNYPTYVEPNQNQNMKLVLNPAFYSSENTNQNPYLTSVNLNRQNSLNYNFKQADAKVHSSFGINLYPQTNLLDYTKHDIYGNKLFDLNRLASATNLVKLNSIADNEGIVELTYKLKRPQSISYDSDYYVKFRMPYRDFIAKINDLLKNPYIRSNPLKVHQELLSVSNLAEASPDLTNIQRDEVSKLILNNGGILINAEVLGISDENANEYLKTIQNLNANLNTNEILNLVENDKTSTRTTSWDSGIPIPYGGALLYQNVNPQYSHDEDPRKFVASFPQRDRKPLPVVFLPAKFGNVLLNPENPRMIYN